MPVDKSGLPGLRRFGLLCLISLLPLVAQAQRDRLTRPIDARRTSVLAGSRWPGLERQPDEGPLDPSFKMSQISLMFQRSASQKSELDKLLVDQQDPLSPNYHHWLQPEEFADRFGLSANDLSRVTVWLTSQGFQIDYVPRSRSWVVFSGTARQVQTAFATEIRRYRVDGELHFANASDISVPADLAGVVAAVRGLDDFHPHPLAHQRVMPDYTSASGSHYLSPDDYATIYDLSPLYTAGYDGTGQSIVVAGQCHIGVADVEAFRSAMGLPANDPRLVLAAGSVDPGSTNSGDCGEAYLDVEWAGGVARNASIILVYGTDALVAVEYAIDQDLAPVISFSFGDCEKGAPSNYLLALQAVAQQANAEGITWVAASGDDGAAGCDANFSPPPATHGLSVGVPASVPEVTAVGGTQFNEGTGNFWLPSNSPTMASAVSYIPEIAWNETATLSVLAASTGGLSIYYPRPGWQTGSGIPGAPFRAVPDVALAAAAHDGYLGIDTGRRVAFSGTSAGAPSFAAMVALLNQYQVANHFQQQPGQGNINPNLYRLAQSVPSAFHDVTSGDNIIPCSGTPDCANGSLGYMAGPGYDPVTGLGSVDANVLITRWTNTGVLTSTSVTAIPTSFDSGSSTRITATVTGVASSGAPTGSVAFTTPGASLGGAGLVASGNTATASLSLSGTQLLFGSNIIAAAYSGDSNFLPSSGNVTVTVTGSPSVQISNAMVTTQLPSGSGCPVPTPAASFLTTDNTVYLFFEATVQSGDVLSNKWIGPGGVVGHIGGWNASPGSYCFTSQLSIRNLPSSLLGAWRVELYDRGALVGTPISFTISAPTVSNSGPLYFIPVPPCHLVDTRAGRGMTGEFGSPFITAGQTRTFHPAQGACPGIPSTAKAFSFNVTAAPTGGILGYMTLWPSSQTQPLVSTLNALKGGSVSNAAIVPAGSDGGVSAFVTNDSDLMVDINGYFDTVASSTATAFYALSPCRAVDTRAPVWALGGPQMPAGTTRTFPLGQSPCLPSSAAAQAYSMNVTVVPAEPLGNLTIWPGGDVPQPPLVSTVSATFADVTANANIALASGSGGAVNIFASNRTDVVLDLNGYFAPPGAPGALLFQPVTPCRVADTRATAGPFGGPLIGAGTSRTFVVPSSACNIPSSARAYSLNVTVVPAGFLGYLSIWPDSQAQPVVSTLNSWDGRIVANAAIVPAGQDGGLSVYGSNDTHVVIDINGYFVAP